jgi:Ca2+-binding EF-hand superfamily protein
MYIWAVTFQQFASALLLPIKGDLKSSQPDASGHDVAQRTCDHFFKMLDLDGNGTVSLHEFQTVINRVFPSWDAGSLVPLFQELDSRKNGEISQEELQHWITSALATTSLDHDDHDHGHH